jgi:hypothetical protein
MGVASSCLACKPPAPSDRRAFERGHGKEAAESVRYGIASCQKSRKQSAKVCQQEEDGEDEDSVSKESGGACAETK